MKAFSDLYTALDETTKTNEKIGALERYFRNAPSSDAAWAVYFLTGRKPKQLVQAPRVVAWAIEAADIPAWLFAESYDAVGDLAETISLLLPEPETSATQSLTYWVEERLLPLKGMPEELQRQAMLKSWEELDIQQRFIWNKLITGAFRVGVSQQLVVRALAAASGLDGAAIAHRLMGSWQPTPLFYDMLVAKESNADDISRPFPFCLAYPFEGDPSSLGNIGDWQAEWKWDGIRAQLIKRSGQVFIWSRGEELITDRFPEIVEISASLPNGIAIDGELLPWREANVLPFALLQQRIGRKNLSKKLLAEVPVILMAYDLLEYDDEDIRKLPLVRRRQLLAEIICGLTPGSHSFIARRQETPTDSTPANIEDPTRKTTEESIEDSNQTASPHSLQKPAATEIQLRLPLMDSEEMSGLLSQSGHSRETRARQQTVKRQEQMSSPDFAHPSELDHALATCQRVDPRLRISPLVEATSWHELSEIRTKARSLNVEGLMLKRLDSTYKVGRQKGDWWKWKVNPFTIDAVLIYAQRGSGKRASLYTDYTFGVWDGDALVPIAKAYSGLSDDEIRQVDAYVRENTLDKFGPVRTVKPHLVFELGFEGIQKSTRHKAGVAVRFPRMLRWRQDKPASEADALETLKALLPERK
jgi:DNA ligase-1